MVRAEVIETIAKRIARMEGYTKTSSLSFKNNNPGNLRSWGKMPVTGGFAVFPTAEAGWNALRKQISLNIDRNLTFLEFFGGKPGIYPGFAPDSDGNHSKNYAKFVAEAFKVPAETKIKELIK